MLSDQTFPQIPNTSSIYLEADWQVISRNESKGRDSISIKKSYLIDHALNVINSWLSKCGELRLLYKNFNYVVKYALKNSNGCRPLKFDTLKLKNKMLYNLLNS
jgi:hypothetical protein